MKAEELTASDLMIGDWVMTETGGETYPIQIGCLPGILDRYNVTPIEITPEILEKIGFRDMWQTKGNVLNIDNVYINYNISDGYLFIIKDCDDILDVTDIHYVHELQHALRLCKIDKEIRL